MSNPRLVVCLPTEVSRLVAAEFGGADVDVVAWDGSDPAPSELADADVYVPSYRNPIRDPAVLASLGRLRLIQLLTAGYDGWPDRLPEGVLLSNAVGVHGVSTAELAVALVLAASRELPRHLDDQRAHVWHQESQIGLTERPVLVLGAGDIGDKVAAALRPLGAQVTLVGRTARGDIRSIDDLRELLPGHRVVVVAVPLSDATRGLLDRETLALLPDGAIVVNVARGPIVDTEALRAELVAGRLRAGLDVTDPEPLPADHPLWDAPNLILTPHIGGGTRDWPVRAAGLVASQLRRMLDGESPDHVVAGKPR